MAPIGLIFKIYDFYDWLESNACMSVSVSYTNSIEPLNNFVYVLSIHKYKIKETNLPPNLQKLITKKVLHALWCFIKQNFCLKKTKCYSPIPNLLSNVPTKTKDVLMDSIFIHYNEETKQIIVEYDVDVL